MTENAPSIAESFKLPISAMIVGLNEGHLLEGCFQSLFFCNDIHYTDLGSTDNSLMIAEQYAQHIYRRAPVPSCEMIQTEIVHYTKNDWVAFIDPDEVVDPGLSEQIILEFGKIVASSFIGGVIVPWQFYFKRNKLKGTIWGGRNQKFFLVNKYRFSFDPVVHYGRKLKKGYVEYTIKLNEDESNVLHHYWMSSYRGFISKHLRYLKNEGTDNYNLGLRAGKKDLLVTPFQELFRSYVSHKGYSDGFVGIFLSLFWAFYRTAIVVDIYKIQLKIKRQLQ